MATQSPDVEILVHVNAPSRVTSDATYRQLALAYLAFEPSTYTSLPGHETEEEDLASDVPDQIEVQPQPSSSQEFASSSQAIVIGSQDLSFQSALDNRASPRLPTSTQHNHTDTDIVPSPHPGDGGSQKSWCAPPSQISDSYPMPHAAMYISPTRVLQRFVNPSAPHSPKDSSPSPSAHLDGGTHRDNPSPRHIDIASSVSESSSEEQSLQAGYVNARKVVPVTPLISTAVKRRNVDENCQDESAWDTTHISSSDLSVHPQPTPSSRAESEPPPAKRAKNGDPSPTANDSKNLVRSSSDTGTAPRTPNPKELETLEIIPPSPPVGVDIIEPASLISDKLAKLATDLSSRYRPDARREIQPLERGYWLIDCTAWNVETRTETWIFLRSYLKSGLAGWGVWCRRDAAHAWIRLYCWGHIAKHTYLLLYLASGRNLKLTGAEWRGADGEVALKVPSHEKQA